VRSKSRRLWRSGGQVRWDKPTGEVCPGLSVRRTTHELAAGLVVGALFALVLIDPAAAGPRCVQTCKLDTRRCIREECTGLRGKARRECRERCRGAGGCTHPPIFTLAYVVTECRVNAEGVVGRQELRIRRGNCDPVRISFCVGGESDGEICRMEEAGACSGGVCGGFYRRHTRDPRTVEACRAFGQFRYGGASSVGGVFHRLAVSPDGSTVLFELAKLGWFPGSQFDEVALEEGIYSVRADGSQLQRLRRPSVLGHWDAFGATHVPDVGVYPLLAPSSGFNFSPNGKSVVLTVALPPSTTVSGVVPASPTILNLGSTMEPFFSRSGTGGSAISLPSIRILLNVTSGNGRWSRGATCSGLEYKIVLSS
jgi:hypothetical protein